jgi:hypothetical protein
VLAVIESPSGITRTPPSDSAAAGALPTGLAADPRSRDGEYGEQARADRRLRDAVNVNTLASVG